ncbi:MAG: PcfJ domain-containing protein [Myxococcota bacterium]
MLGAPADAADPWMRAAARFVEAVRRVAPRVVADARLHVPLWLLSLQADHWIRPLRTWSVTTRSRDRQFRSLVEHLLVRYRVPPFVWIAIHVPGSAREVLALIAHLGRGGSMRVAVHQRLVPATMTRAMCNAFTQVSDAPSIVQAVRAAQLHTLGAPPWLRHAVCRTFLGRELADDGFWLAAIHWLARNADAVGKDQIAHVLDYLRHQREADPDFEVHRRVLRGLSRRMAQWQLELAEARDRSEAFAPSGLAPGAWLTEREAESPEYWELVELRLPRELAAEGRRLEHCVFSYRSRARRGRCSIWSLRRSGKRRVTIEVCSASRAVVQIRGRRNRAPKPNELALVRRWAAANRLSVAVRG